MLSNLVPTVPANVKPCQLVPASEDAINLEERFAVLPVLVPLQVRVRPVNGRVETSKGVNLPLVVNYPVATSRLWAEALNWTNLGNSFNLQLKIFTQHLFELKEVEFVQVLILLHHRLLANNRSQVSSFCLSSLRILHWRFYVITKMVSLWEEPRTRPVRLYERPNVSLEKVPHDCHNVVYLQFGHMSSFVLIFSSALKDLRLLSQFFCNV